MPSFLNTRTLVLGLFLVISGACETAQEQAALNPKVTDFPDVLDVYGVPDDPNDLSVYSFADQGAWHSFGMPDSSSLAHLGGFTGPFLMTHGNGMWLSRSLARLRIYDVQHDVPLALSEATDVLSNNYPGRLHQTFRVDGLAVALDLIFITDRSALVRAHIENVSDEMRTLRLGWHGGVFMEGASLVAAEEGLTVRFTEDPAWVVLALPPNTRSRITLRDSSRAYAMELNKAVEVAPGEAVASWLVQSAYFDVEERAADAEQLSAVWADPEQAFAENEERWNGYLNAVLSRDSPWLHDPENRAVAVKAIETLLTNWRSPAGHLYYAGLFPSYAYRGFHGMWSWDSWKHAVALARFAPELAREQMRVMFDYQDAAGMVADVIYRDSSENNWRDTKPPLSAWAVWSIYEATDDRLFLEEMYPKIVKYHRWWYAHRDHDGNGIAEYGSTDGTRIAAAWESGMDNAVRFDEAVMVQNGPGAWSLNQESVDLNAYLHAEKHFLANVGDVLGEAEESAAFRQEAETLKAQIQQLMFDDETGYFYDIRLEDKAQIRIQGPEGWIPLWAGVATPEQAERVRQVMLNPETFYTYVPFPTLAADHPEFNPQNGYWRGPVWMDQAYFAVQGLRRYGFDDAATRAVQRLLDRAAGLKQTGAPIYENYHPVTGEGLNAAHFSWSAAHYLMFITDDG